MDTNPARSALLAAAGLFLGACGAEPLHISLAELCATPERFAGRSVVVSGTLRTFPEPRHYWIENAALDRVGLDGGDGLPALEGWTVEVRGTFLHDRSAGRRIRVQSLSATK